jgi:sec-independent protein translocase protein TatC
MPAPIRPIGHEDRLSLVEHLDELRSRLIICAVTLAVAFAACAAFNDSLLGVLNEPREQTTQKSIQKGRGLPGQIERTQQAVRVLGAATDATIAALNDPDARLPAAQRRALRAQQLELRRAIGRLPRTQGNKPVTLRVGEPFGTTLTVSLYFALLFSLPVILFQLYAFVLPAFSPHERRVALPLMSMVPVLFVIGVVFGYFVVLPPAVRFLQNFNSDEFNVLVQATDYYRFEVLALVGLGLLFQIPVGVLAATRLGIVTTQQLRRNRRYALLIIAVVAMLLPGTDPVTMLIAMAPLLLLYELSILLARWLGRPIELDEPEDEGPLEDDETTERDRLLS